MFIRGDKAKIKNNVWGMVLLILVCIFCFAPMLFIEPKCNVKAEALGERGLPVYTIDVRPILPVKSVVAKLDTTNLPVYAVDSHLYTVEPTDNGNLVIVVTLFNNKKTIITSWVSASDKTPPEYLGFSEAEGQLTMYFTDSESGVDYESARLYGEGESVGQEYSSIDPMQNSITFANVKENSKVIISDHSGNETSIRFR